MPTSTGWLRDIDLPLNLEMAATDEMLAIALAHKPHAACIVPEKREERTTEGGIDAVGQHNKLAPFVRALNDAKIRVSLFVEASKAQLDAAQIPRRAGGRIAHRRLLRQRGRGARPASRGHPRGGAPTARRWAWKSMPATASTFDNVGPIAAIPEIRELNIGHFLIGEAIFSGLDAAIRRMRALMDEARARADGRDTA